MYRLNVLKNYSNLTNKLFMRPQNVIAHIKNPLHSTAIKCPVGKTVFDNLKSQKLLLQITKNNNISQTIQYRGAATAGDHVRMWQMERVLSAALIPLLPGIFLIDSQILETLCAGIVTMHIYWGIEAIIVDYLRPSVVGNVAPKVAHISLNVVSALVLAGLLMLIYSGNGIANTIKRGWAIGKNPN